MNRKTRDIKVQNSTMFTADECVPFDSVEEAWFWFIAAQQARNDGAQYVSGASVVRRPCEPVDILKVLDGLYRKRRLQRDHLLVLRHYGRRHMAPDVRRAKEERAFYLWREAFDRMRPVMEDKGIIAKKHWITQFSQNDGFAAPSLFPNYEGVAAE